MNYNFKKGDLVQCIGQTSTGAPGYPTVGESYVVLQVHPNNKRIKAEVKVVGSWWYAVEDFVPSGMSSADIAKKIVEDIPVPIYTQVGFKDPKHLRKVLAALIGENVSIVVNDETGNITDRKIHDVTTEEVVLWWEWDDSGDEGVQKTKFEQIAGVMVK